jgi:double-stranded uracil-DNA glycosylase
MNLELPSARRAWNLSSVCFVLWNPHHLCPRPTRRADELSRGEIRAGAEALRVQPEPAVPGVVDIVVPSPSGLNRMRFEELVEHYRALAGFVR